MNIFKEEKGLIIIETLKSQLDQHNINIIMKITHLYHIFYFLKECPRLTSSLVDVYVLEGQ